MSRASIGRRLGAAVLGATLAVVALAGPAEAATGVTATLTASKGAITVDLAGATYAATPNWVRIAAMRNSCTAASPCWTGPDAAVYLSDDFTGSTVLTGLHANTTYQVQLTTDTGDALTATATTPKDVNAAPTDPPLVDVTADGLKALVTVQPETDTEALNDGTPIAKLRYDVDAYANGKRLKRVLTNVAAGAVHTISGLPRNTPITFAETEVNSVGESPETATPGGVRLTATAPGAFTGTWQTTAATGSVRWSTPTPGAGRIAKYVVTVLSGSRTVFTKTVGGGVNQTAITHLARRSTYTASVTAVNSYGTSTAITGSLVTT